MRKIKLYNSFLEDLAVSANDSPAQRMAKQAVNTDSDYIEDYRAKKDSLRSLYLDVDAKGNFKTIDERLKEELEKILGKEEAKDGPDRNPLLQELTTVLDLQRQLITLTKRLNSEKTRMEEAGDEASQEEGTRKDELKKREGELKDKVTNDANQLSELTRRAEEAKRNFDKKIADFEKNITQSTEQIKKTPPK